MARSREAAAPRAAPPPPVEVQEELELPGLWDEADFFATSDVHILPASPRGRWSQRVGPRTWVGVAPADEWLIRRGAVHRALEELPAQVDKVRRRFSTACGTAVVFGISTRVTSRPEICAACFGDGW